MPKTVAFKETKAKKGSGPSNSAVNGEGSGSGSREAGQTTLDGKQFPVMNGTNGSGSGMNGNAGDDHEDGQDGGDDDDPNTQLEMESRQGARTSVGSAGVNGEDVEMS